MPTRYQLHVEKWRRGCGHECCARATRVVFARGQLPCDVLFVGEAPGVSENSRGVPFDGPAGSRLDDIVRAAVGPENEERAKLGLPPLRVAFYNVVGCIPLEETGKKAGMPSDDQIIQCKPRIEEFLTIADPRLIVCVGRVAEDWLAPGYKTSIKTRAGVAMVEITHPAAIMRLSIVQQGYEVQAAKVTVANAVEELR